MTEQLEKRMVELAEYLLPLEKDARLIKQNRSPSNRDKFNLSTAWLCKKLIASYATSPTDDGYR